MLVAAAVEGRLTIVDVASGEVRQLDTAGSVIAPRPDPAGRTIGYVSEGSLRLVDVDGGNDRVLVAAPGPDVSYGLPEHVAAESFDRQDGFWWAPDGSALLIARVDNSGAADGLPGRSERRAGTAATAALPVRRRPQCRGDAALVRPGRRRDRGGLGPRRVRVPAGGPLGRARPVDRRPEPGADRGAAADGRPGDRRDHRSPCREGGFAASGAASACRRGWPAASWSGWPTSRTPGGCWWPASRSPRPRCRYARSSTCPATACCSTPRPSRPRSTSTNGRRPAGCASCRPGPGVHAGVRGGDTVVLASRGLEIDGVRTVVRAAGRPDGEIGCLALPTEPPRVEIFSAGVREIRTAVLLPRDPELAAGPLPVLFAPYGGPGAQQVMRARDSYRLSQWFADQGFAVVVADGRGTPARGQGLGRCHLAGQGRPGAGRPGRDHRRRQAALPAAGLRPGGHPRLVVRRVPDRACRAAPAGRLPRRRRGRAGHRLPDVRHPLGRAVSRPSRRACRGLRPVHADARCPEPATAVAAGARPGRRQRAARRTRSSCPTP